MDHGVYRLTADVDYPESGPRLSAGDLVKMIEWCGDAALVISLNPQDDPGNGEDGVTREYTTAWVATEDLVEP
jgi:hypothetical protein